MSLRYTRPQKNIIHVHADSQFELTRTFVRLQEFYESPYDAVRGQVGWDLDFLAKQYVADGKPFDYFSKWNGMNVPGHVVWNFFANFSDLSADECKLSALLYRATRYGSNPHNFYLIGTWKDEDITHEIAHALFYLDATYAAKMLDLVQGLQITQHSSVYTPLKVWLLTRGYSETVLNDEMQAYLATSDMKYLQSKLGKIDGGFIFTRAAAFRAAFKLYAGMEPI
jgi:hypothetical protein